MVFTYQFSCQDGKIRYVYSSNANDDDLKYEHYSIDNLEQVEEVVSNVSGLVSVEENEERDMLDVNVGLPIVSFDAKAIEKKMPTTKLSKNEFVRNKIPEIMETITEEEVNTVQVTKGNGEKKIFFIKEVCVNFLAKPLEIVLISPLNFAKIFIQHASNKNRG